MRAISAMCVAHVSGVVLNQHISREGNVIDAVTPYKIDCKYGAFPKDDPKDGLDHVYKAEEVGRFGCKRGANEIRSPMDGGDAVTGNDVFSGCGVNGENFDYTGKCMTPSDTPAKTTQALGVCAKWEVDLSVSGWWTGNGIWTILNTPCRYYEECSGGYCLPNSDEKIFGKNMSWKDAIAKTRNSPKINLIPHDALSCGCARPSEKYASSNSTYNSAWDKDCAFFENKVGAGLSREPSLKGKEACPCTNSEEETVLYHEECASSFSVHV